EEILEEIAEAATATTAVAWAVTRAAAGRRPAPAVAAHHLLFSGAALPVRSEFVVLLALGRIAEDLVGLVDLLEAGLGLLVVGIEVGMMLAGEFAVGRFDFGIRSAAFDAQGFVVVAKFHLNGGHSP